MRVIRTELYFDDDGVQGASRHFRSRRSLKEKNHGLAFVWFRSGGEARFDIQNHKWFDGKEIEVGQVGQALDLLVRDVDGREIRRVLEDGEIENPAIVDFIVEQNVILEHSPPVAIPFKNLLKKTNSALLVGAYVGHSIAGEHPALMILTIPGGIIAVGSALGIADAMAYGLNKHVKRLFDRK